MTFYKFGKVQFDYRKAIPLDNNQSFNWRINTGYALPYGDDKALPYEKFFFTGGSGSNRAWSPRRLGPGSAFPLKLDEQGNNVIENGEFVPQRTGQDSYRFEQPGEILLEMNFEYRGNITGFIDWAFFVDAGNVWRISEFSDNIDTSTNTLRISQGGKFDFNDFYREIAVGAGLGLRFDFSFLVFRFDAGHKLKDPRFPEGLRWQKPFKRSGQTVWNIAVGYSF